MDNKVTVGCYSDYLKKYLPSLADSAKVIEDHRLLGEEYAAITIDNLKQHLKSTTSQKNV